MTLRARLGLIFLISLSLWAVIIVAAIQYAHATIAITSFSTTVQGNGATTLFNFNFVAGSSQWIQVSYTDSGGTTTVLSPSAYTLTLNPPVAPNLWGIGGTVTYAPLGVPIASGTSLTITRMEPYTQTTSLSSFGPSFKAVEQAIDKVVMQTQQLTANTGGGGSPNAITSLTNDVVASGPGVSPASVVRLQGRNLSNAAPSNGQVLTWVAGNSDWEPANAVGGINTLTGDVTGSGSGTVVTSVVRIQGRTVASTAPSNGQVYAWVTTDSAWEPFTLGTGTGTVLSVGTSAPITGGTFTTVGTIGCPTCVTSGASLTNNGVMTGAGGQASATSPNASLVVGALSLGAAGTEGSVTMGGASTGTTEIRPAANAGTGSIIRLPTGSTDFSATGGTSQVVKQTTAGGAFTVARLACADLSDAAAGCSTGSSVTSVFGRGGAVTAQTGDYSFSQISGTNSATQLGASPVNHAALIDVAGIPSWRVIPACIDTLGNHLNYDIVSDVWSCGTSSSGGGGGSINITDGIHSVTGVGTLTVGNGFVVSGSTPNAILNTTVVEADRSTSCTVAANNTGCTGATGGDMGQVANLTGSGATITFPAASSTIFAPGMTLDISTATATGNWTLSNSTGLTLRGLNSTTLVPGTVGTFVANNDGLHLDFAGQQIPSTTVLGSVLSSSAPSNQFATGINTSGAVTYAQPAVSNLASINNNTIVSNISGITNPPSASSLSAVLDSTTGSTVGNIIYRGPAGWVALAPPITAGNYTLEIAGGVGNVPFWNSNSVTPCGNGQMAFNVACNASFYVSGIN